MAELEQNPGETPPDPTITAGGGDIDIPPDPPTADPVEGGERPKPSRQERRQQRGHDYAAEAREARQAAERASAEVQRQAVELAELRGRVTAGEGGRADPNETALAEIAKKMETVVARMGQGDTTANEDWHKLRREEAKIIARMEAAESSKGVEERVTKSLPRQMDARQSALVAEFPALQDDPEFRDVANGHVARLIRVEKRDMNNPAVKFATLREGAALAAKDLGIGGDSRGAPTALDRERVSGTGSGDSGAGPAGGTRVHLDASQMALAESLFRSLPKAEAHVKWWKEIGSKIPK